MITFASGAAVLTPAARKTLDAAAPDARAAEMIEIRGRTDELGDAQLNDVLAGNRALAVRDYLHQASPRADAHSRELQGCLLLRRRE